MTTTPLNVTDVDFIALTTNDLDAARAFYGIVLNLPCRAMWQRGDAPAMGAEFEAGEVTIALLDAAAIGQTHTPGSTTLALRVDDVAASKDRLLAAGVEFHVPDIDSGVCHMAYFADPDGNRLMLHHRYAPLGERPDLRTPTSE